MIDSVFRRLAITVAVAAIASCGSAQEYGLRAASLEATTMGEAGTSRGLSRSELFGERVSREDQRTSDARVSDQKCVYREKLVERRDRRVEETHLAGEVVVVRRAPSVPTQEELRKAAIRKASMRSLLFR